MLTNRQQKIYKMELLKFFYVLICSNSRHTLKCNWVVAYVWAIIKFITLNIIVKKLTKAIKLSFYWVLKIIKGSYNTVYLLNKTKQKLMAIPYR